MTDLPNKNSVRLRQARAIKYVMGETNYAKDDPEKCLRATYVLVMNDIPALLQTLERAEGYIENLVRALRGAYNDEAPTMRPEQLEQHIRNIMEGLE